MIVLTTNKIGPTLDSMESIDHWEVWFLTPIGLIKSYVDMNEISMGSSMSERFQIPFNVDRPLSFHPVSVAIGKSGYSEPLLNA